MLFATVLSQMAMRVTPKVCDSIEIECRPKCVAVTGLYLPDPSCDLNRELLLG
jgi:hypothetical protein